MILKSLLFLLLFILLVIFFIISLPYFYFFKFKYEDEFQYEIHINVAFIKLKYLNFKDYNKTIINIFSYQKEIKRNIDDTTENKKTKKSNKKNKSKTNFPIRIITKKNINHFLNFLIKIFQQLKPNTLNLDLLISFADPYYNGLISAYYFSLKNIYPDLPIKIVVNWQEEVVEGQGIISGKIIPIVFFYQLLRFIFSPQTIKILWQIKRHKK